MSKNKVSIKINGKEYVVMGGESEEYMHEIAKHIDKKITEIAMSSSQLNLQTVTILAAINLTDDYFKSIEAADNLRLQVAQYIDDVSKERGELNTLKAENERFKDQLQRYQIELAKKDAEIQSLSRTGPTGQQTIL